MESLKHPVHAPAGREPLPENLLRDLTEILSGDRALYFMLGPDGAVLTVKAEDTFAFGERIPASWINMTPRKRAEAVAGWIQRAADYCRHPRIRYERTETDPINGASHQKGGEA